MRLDGADARQLDDVVAAVREVLADDVVAVLLHGSATAGGLRPDSDLDLLVVTTGPLGDRDRPLVAALTARSGRRNGLRPVELTVVRQDAVRPWRYPPRRELQYGEWLRTDLDAWLAAAPSDDDAAGAGTRAEPPWGGPEDPDLAVLVTQARRDGVALVGPPADVVLDPVPAQDLRASVVHGVPGLLADLADDTRNVLLTLARVVVTLRTGRVVSKDLAADELSGDLPDDLRAVLLLARDAYLGAASDDWTAHRDAARRLTDHLVALADTDDTDG